MRGVRAWLVRLVATLTPWRRDRHLADELNGHLELAIDDNIRAGMSLTEARRNALRALGGLTSTEERCRQRRGVPAFDNIGRDLKYAFRRLGRNPGFAVLCIVIIALGVGANTAVFSVVNAVLLKPLPYPDPDRIVTLSYASNRPGPRNALSGLIAIPDVEDWRTESTSFDAMAYYQTFRTSVTAGPLAEYAVVTRISPGFFRVFGMQPSAGRLFTPEEDGAAGQNLAIVSSTYARSHFGDFSNAIGQQLQMFGRPVTVVGVLPSGKTFPDQADIWSPSNSTRDGSSRTSQNFLAIGRLKKAVSLQQARVELTSIATRLARAYPDTNARRSVLLMPLLDDTVGDARGMLNLLLGAVGLLLLIACANVGTLLLARATGRAHEIAARVALGASRGRIIRQLLIEGLMHALLAGAAGFFVAILGTRALVAAAPANVPRLAETGVVNGSVLAFTLVVSVIVSVLFALPPALNASAIDVNDPKRQASGRTVIGGRGRRLHGTLVVAEVALTVVLLIGAGLLVRSLVALQSVSLGFRPDHVLVMEATVPEAGLNGARANAFFSGLLSEVSTLPDVTAVGATMAPPGSVSSSGGYWIDHLPADFNPDTLSPGGLTRTIMSVTAPGTFTALDVPLKQGRDFRNSDTRDAPLVAIINETLARQAFGSNDPLGHAIFCTFDSLAPMTIVGVVGDVRQYGPAQAADAECFMPYLQHFYNRNSLSVLVRTSGDPAALSETIRRKAREHSPDVSVKLTTMETLVDEHMATPRFRAVLVTLFGVVALVLALAGVYGVMAYTVGERSKEIGLRMALGAPSGNVMWMMLRRGLQLVGTGLAIGILGAIAATRFIDGMLFDVAPVDSFTYLAVIGVLGVTSAFAIYLPLRRSTSGDPLSALRQE